MPKFDLMISRFPFKRQEDPDVGDYFSMLTSRLRNGDEISEMIGAVHATKHDDTPITMTRNAAVEEAKRFKADLLMMIDSDVTPDYLLGEDKMAQPFFDSAFKFMIEHKGPSIVAAPYCGPPPHENIYAFKAGNWESNNPNVDVKVDQFTREEVAQRSGIERCMALATGHILIDMRVFQHLKPPYFEYEYEDPPYNTKKASTEDVYFTRNAAVAGIPVYCNWYSWAKHWKLKGVGKPNILTPDQVHGIYKKAFTEPRLDSDVTLLQFKSKAG